MNIAKIVKSELYQAIKSIYPQMDRDTILCIYEELVGENWNDTDIRVVKKKICG